MGDHDDSRADPKLEVVTRYPQQAQAIGKWIPANWLWIDHSEKILIAPTLSSSNFLTIGSIADQSPSNTMDTISEVCDSVAEGKERR